MSENGNAKEGRLKKIRNTVVGWFSNKNDNSNAIRDDSKSDIPTPPKRKQKQNASPPPTKRSKESSSMPNESNHNVQNSYKTSENQNEIETTNKDLSKLNIGPNNDNRLQINKGHPQKHTLSKSFPTENENKRGESSKSGKQHNNNKNTIKPDQVPQYSKNDNIRNTKSKSFNYQKGSGSIIPRIEPARAHQSPFEKEFQNSSRNTVSSDRMRENVKLDQNIKHDKAKFIPSQISEDATCKLDNRKLNSPKDDNTNKSLNKGIENNNAIEKANKDFSKLNISQDNNKSLQNDDLPQKHTVSESSLTENANKHGESSKLGKQRNNNQNTMKPNQVQQYSKNDNIRNTKSKSFNYQKGSGLIIPKSEPARAENSQFENECKKSSRNKDLTKDFEHKLSDGMRENVKLDLDVKHDEDISLQNLKETTHNLENEILNSPQEDNTNKSLNKDIGNKEEIDMAFEQINSVMEEVNNIKLDMQNLDNPQESFIFESALTNAMIKLDGIQMSKNKSVKEHRKKGMLYIQEVFSLLDGQEANGNLQ